MNSINSSAYVPKMCAFHPKELIYNFCKNKQCLLPLCPSCVNVHSEEHKLQSTYGQFQNIHKVVSDVSTTLEGNIQDLTAFEEQIKQNIDHKAFYESQTRRKIKESKQKVMNLVERFFEDFEKEVNKSIVAFNCSMKENYHQLDVKIKNMKGELSQKINSLSTDKVLKTLIGYYSKDEENKINNNLDVLRETIDVCSSKRIALICENSSIQKIINELSNYMYLTFQNWENDIKYVGEFVKTGFTHKTAQHSRECSFFEG